MSDATDLKTLFDLSGRTAIVTGGSRGLGMQISEALGEFGAHIIITARKQNELDEAVAHLASKGIGATAIAADLSREETPQRIVDEIAAQGRSVEILVNNAGSSWGAKSEEMPLDAWNKMLMIHMTAPFLLAQAVANKWMIPSGYGRIVNIASVEGMGGHHPRMIGTLGYNSAKGGVINMTRSLAAEWGAKGITVNAIAPGYFPSKLTAYTFEHHEQHLTEVTPRGKLGGPADLKGAALLFASDAGQHITGQILPIDGGAIVI